MESSIKALSTAVTAARVFLAIVLLIAGVPKLIVGTDLADRIRALGIKRREAVIALRMAVPTAEIALGLWLVTGSYPGLASFTAAAMLMMFTYVLVQLRARDAGGCACFLWDDGKIGVGHLVRNLVLAAIAVLIGIVTRFGWYAWRPVWELPTQTAMVVAASVLFVLLLYTLIATSLRFSRNVAANS